jgi:hypothetical protein
MPREPYQRGLTPQALLDMTGWRIGSLMVLSRAENGSRGRARWLCHCDCGKFTTVIASALRDGRTKSCGQKGCRRRT